MKVYCVFDDYSDNQLVAVCKSRKLAKELANVWPDRFYVQKTRVASKMPLWFKEMQNDRR